MTATVACVLRVGSESFIGRSYTADWVVRLRSMVSRATAQDHRFVCLSNVEVPGIETIPLIHGWPGWWSKIELFRSDIDLGERVLYLDLDVLVVGSLDEIIDYPSEMVLSPPHHVLMGIQPKDKAGVVRRYNAGVMAWSPPAGRSIYEDFCPAVMDKYRSDQDWIGDLFYEPDLDTLDPSWVCKLRQCDRSGPPAGVKVVFSQHPMANDKAAEKYPWVRQVWSA